MVTTKIEEKNQLQSTFEELSINFNTNMKKIIVREVVQFNKYFKMSNLN
jgi:hypothetical protein